MSLLSNVLGFVSEKQQQDLTGKIAKNKQQSAAVQALITNAVKSGNVEGLQGLE